MVLVSNRNKPLVWSLHPVVKLESSTLTVEDSSKWYSLYLVCPNGSIEEVPFPGDGWVKPGETACGDHVPNPDAVLRYAVKNGYEIDERAFEIIVGRWHLEHLDEHNEEL